MNGSRTAKLGRVVHAATAIGQITATDRELLRRFAQRNDQRAFEILANRHTSMVLGVCRRALSTVQDAEDACQATFIVLAKRAKSGQWQESVANWLYTTARKVARNAHIAAERRIKREICAARPEAFEPIDRMTGRELLASLDAALGDLPPHYREPLVLCYLEGLTHQEAATWLRVPLGTLHTRINRGLKRLHQVLTKSGCTLGASLLAVVASSPAQAASPRLVKSILSNVSGSVPAAVAGLAEGIGKYEAFNKTMLVVAIVLGLVGLGVSLGLIEVKAEEPVKDAVPLVAQTSSADKKPNTIPSAQLAQSPEKIAENSIETVTYCGRVLGPDGKPIGGAILYKTQELGNLIQTSPLPECATTDRDGRFKFTVPNARYGYDFIEVAASAPNYGIGWVVVHRNAQKDNLTIQLVKDDVPITGQIINLEGKPVSGANVTVERISASTKEDLEPWLDAVKGRKETGWNWNLNLESQYFPSRMVITAFPKATTDAEGHFKLTGIGNNRLVTLRVEGPTIATQNLQVLTRVGEAITFESANGGIHVAHHTFYGARFRHSAAPTKPVYGVVLDKETKNPLAGVTIQSIHTAGNPIYGRDVITVITDSQGRYRLVGMPRGEGNRIIAIPGNGEPYLISTADVADSPGLEPVKVDFELKRGIWIEGRITDNTTGKPLQAHVEYMAASTNPNLKDHAGFRDIYFGFPGYGDESKKDGTYKLVGLLGPGFIVVPYSTGRLRATERDDKFGMKEHSIQTAPYELSILSNYSVIAAIEPVKGIESEKQDVTLDLGWTFTGTVLGEDGKPLAGSRMFDVYGPCMPWMEKMGTSDFIVRGYKPDQSPITVFQHPEKNLVGILQPPKENGGVITVQMKNGAAVSGRLLDPSGKPRANVKLGLLYDAKKTEPGWWWGLYTKTIQTDKDGRFRVEALMPGFSYKLIDKQGSIEFGDGIQFGEVKELGDIRLKPE